MPDTAAWPLALGVLGAIVGSFVAALAIRWPQGRSVVHGRSNCDACGHQLGARDLVPIVSVLVLRGRCRHCGASIDARHGVIEVAAVAIGAAAGTAVAGPQAFVGAEFGWLLLALAALDWSALWLPDRLTGTLGLAGLLTCALGLAPGLNERLIGGAAGFGVLWLIGWGYERLRGRRGLGGGDPKLFGAIGLWLGWRLLPSVLLLASLVGLGLVLFRHFTGRTVARDDQLPFGAFLAISAYPTWLAMIITAA